MILVLYSKVQKLKVQ